MLKGQRVGGILLMGGVGKRFGSEIPKQFHRLSGKAIYLVTLDVFLKTNLFDELVLSCHPDWIEEVKKELDPSWPITIVSSGNTRQQSSYQGLKGFNIPPDIVIIHDAVRPFVTAEILQENALLAIEHGAVDTCIASSDTLVHAPELTQIQSIPNRAHYLRGQTPQSFSYSLILEAHQKTCLQDASDDCRLVLEQNHPVWIAKGDEQNLKITSELDLFIAEQLFRLQRTTPSSQNTSFLGKTYAVVGGTGGIGREVCQLLKENQATVHALSRQTGVDLQNPASIEEAFQRIGPVDGLINCAGWLKKSPIDQLSLQEIDRLLAVNLRGVILCCKWAQLNPRAHVINIASSSFTRGRKEMGLYSCAKAGVVNFTQALCEERPDLRVHTVVPQRTNTPMRQSNFPNEDPATLLDPKVVAKEILTLLQDTHSTGLLIEVKGATFRSFES